MRGLANPDSKIFSLLNKVALLLELNVLVCLSCLPLVTVGTSLCSMHAVLLKIYRNEEKRIFADFFQAMKSNLKNGTILWLLFLGYLGILIGIWNFAVSQFPDGATYVLFSLLFAAVIGMLYLDWALILLSRYVYTVPECLKYALLAWMKYPGSTLVYLISLAAPLLLCCSIQTMPLVFLLAVTLSHLISTTLYSRVFDQMEGVSSQLPQL